MFFAKVKYKIKKIRFQCKKYSNIDNFLTKHDLLFLNFDALNPKMEQNRL